MTPGLAIGLGAGSSLLGGALSGLGGGPKQDVKNKPFWNNLFSQGNQLMGQQQQGLQGLFPLGQDLSQQGQGFLNQLGQGGQQMQPFAGQGFTGQQIGVLGNQLGQFYNEQLLPGIQGNAIQAGQLGSGRQGVAQGIAGRGMGQAFGEGIVGILQQDLYRRQQAAQAGGAQQIAGAAGGLQGLMQPFQAAYSPFQAQWSPLQGMAGLLGSQQSALQGGGGLLGGLGQGLGNAFNVGINLDPTAPTQQGYTV